MIPVHILTYLITGETSCVPLPGAPPQAIPPAHLHNTGDGQEQMEQDETPPQTAPHPQTTILHPCPSPPPQSGMSPLPQTTSSVIVAPSTSRQQEGQVVRGRKGKSKDKAARKVSITPGWGEGVWYPWGGGSVGTCPLLPFFDSLIIYSYSVVNCNMNVAIPLLLHPTPFW